MQSCVRAWCAVTCLRSSQLLDQLVLKETELQRQKVDEELHVDNQEARNWEKSTGRRKDTWSWRRKGLTSYSSGDVILILLISAPSVMLEELLAAQRDREQAVMSRLLLANDERDEAVRRAQNLQQASE